MASGLIKNSFLQNRKILLSNFHKHPRLEIDELLKQLKREDDFFVVEIGKNPKNIFNRSVWAGHRMGSVSTWLNAMLYQLPYKRFYLFVDDGVDEETLEYYDSFYKNVFYKNYMGLCSGPRERVPSSFLHEVNSIKAPELLETFENKRKTFLIDVRTPDQARKLPVENLPMNTQYVNISLDNDDLTEKLNDSLRSFDPENHQIVTMCARGYRGTIAYSLFRHILKIPSFEMKVCQSTTD